MKTPKQKVNRVSGRLIHPCAKAAMLANGDGTLEKKLGIRVPD
jgi:hypothetical protein